MRITTKDVIRTVATTFEVAPRDLLGPWRDRKIVQARHAAFWLARRHTMLSYPAIGRIFNRDHSTIVHGINKVEIWRRGCVFNDLLLQADSRLKAQAKRKTNPKKMEIYNHV